MEILVTGASGYVGSSLMEELAPTYAATGTYARNHGPDLVRMDITNGHEVQDVLSAAEPRVIIHGAGITGKADDHPELGRSVNIDGTRNIVKAAQAIGANVIFLSSAAVFNGQDGLFTETDTVGSRGEYGKTKIEAEKIVQGSGLAHLIIRPSLVVGTAPRGTERTYTGRIAKSIRNSQPQEVNGTWRFSPTLTTDIAATVKWWLDGGQGEVSLLHIGTPEVSTQLDLARKVAAAADRDPELFTEGEEWSPGNNVLDTSRAQRLGVPLHTLEGTARALALSITEVTRG